MLIFTTPPPKNVICYIIGMVEAFLFSTANSCPCHNIYSTNKPGKHHTVISGISDHDIILVDGDIIAKVNKKPPRKIQKFHKGNWDKMKVETQEFKHSFMDQYQNRSPDENYKKLKSHLNNITEKYVPSQMSCFHFSQPWNNSTVRRMCNKKQRPYNKAKCSHKQKH